MVLLQEMAIELVAEFATTLSGQVAFRQNPLHFLVFPLQLDTHASMQTHQLCIE